MGVLTYSAYISLKKLDNYKKKFLQFYVEAKNITIYMGFLYELKN